MTAKHRRRLLLTELLRTHGATARGFFAPQRDRAREEIPAQARDVTLSKRGRDVTAAVVVNGPTLGEMRKAEREQQAARRQSRADQGWSQRRGLSYRPLKHDGSTAEQRARRTTQRDSPWIPA